jgi:hypothetical protein
MDYGSVFLQPTFSSSASATGPKTPMEKQIEKPGEKGLFR